MSQLLQIATRGGVITTEALNPDYFDQGIPYTASHAVAVEDLGPIDHYWQGLPFTIGGRLSVTINGTVASIQNGGMPINAAGFLVIGTGAIDHFSAGIPYTATDQIAVV